MDNPFEQINDRLVTIEKILHEFQESAGLPTILPPSKEKLLSIKQLCEHLKITEPTALRWRKKGKIPFYNIGASIRFKLSEVLDSLANNKSKTIKINVGELVRDFQNKTEKFKR
jgi:excisionase family DNA binding protein